MNIKKPWVFRKSIILFGIWRFNFDRTTAAPAIKNAPRKKCILLFSIPNLYINGYMIEITRETPKKLPRHMDIMSSTINSFLIKQVINDIMKVSITDIKTMIRVAIYFDFTIVFEAFGKVLARQSNLLYSS